jgi:hypothetical protein
VNCDGTKGGMTCKDTPCLDGAPNGFPEWFHCANSVSCLKSSHLVLISNIVDVGYLVP